MAPMPCSWQLAHLHGLGDPFHILLGLLDPVLQVVQNLPHLLDVLEHVCNAEHRQSDPREDRERDTPSLDGLSAPHAGPAPTVSYSRT